MIAIGTCSKFPTKLCGRRVRVLPSERRGEWPRQGGIGTLDSVSGPFVQPHDGIGECECVHVVVDSGFSVLFDDGQNWSGYPPHALELVNEPPAVPSPGRLWKQAGGDHARYVELMKQHGHIIPKTPPAPCIACGEQTTDRVPDWENGGFAAMCRGCG